MKERETKKMWGVAYDRNGARLASGSGFSTFPHFLSLSLLHLTMYLSPSSHNIFVLGEGVDTLPGGDVPHLHLRIRRAGKREEEA